ncbi:MAG: hypothetical protein IPH44_34600 [Myxococcales bacterium]|nr:hypothetical protein [Myxococcales bacterium]MBK7192545.1 hypothetical protein [Myxococcales bacterium]MBP6848109.1 hypothetical protein [Kofleriaceae bacterium]
MSEPLFHVFIERARSTAPTAGRDLARAIAARYGIPGEELEKRFAMGRFRVKGNVDRATADSYAADLASLGAVCTVVAAGATPAPVATAQAMTLPGAQRVSPPAAAPSPSMPVQDLGALTGEMPLTLSTLDGASEEDARASRKIPLAASFGPPDSEPGRQSSKNIALPASFGPPADPEPARQSSKNIALPASFGPPPDEEPAQARSASRKVAAVAEPALFDPFAPPEMQSEEQELVLAVERKPKQSAAPPPATVAAEAPLPPPPSTMHAPAASAAPRAPAAPRGSALGFLRDEGARFVVGVVLVTLLGAIPALLIGSARVRSAFARLDNDLEQRQEKARKNRDDWEQLDRVRASFLARKRDERQTIAITSVLMWAAASGGLAFVWFRKIDWDRVTR